MERIRRVVYVCGGMAEAEKPSAAHYVWHRKHGETPCLKSAAEERWYQAERRLGRALPYYDYQALEVTHVCGEYHQRERPSQSHYSQHKKRGEEPCGKAMGENSWYQAEYRTKQTIPDWYPGWPGDERKRRS